LWLLRKRLLLLRAENLALRILQGICQRRSIERPSAFKQDTFSLSASSSPTRSALSVFAKIPFSIFGMRFQLLPSLWRGFWRNWQVGWGQLWPSCVRWGWLILKNVATIMCRENARVCSSFFFLSFSNYFYRCISRGCWTFPSRLGPGNHPLFLMYGV
jgi:hypothetical protein